MTGFQYTDPLEGRATIVGSRSGGGAARNAAMRNASNVNAVGVGGAAVSVNVGGMHGSTGASGNAGGEVSMGLALTAGGGSAELNQFPSAPATGGLAAMSLTTPQQQNNNTATSLESSNLCPALDKTIIDNNNNKWRLEYPMNAQSHHEAGIGEHAVMSLSFVRLIFYPSLIGRRAILH